MGGGGGGTEKRARSCASVSRMRDVMSWFARRELAKIFGAGKLALLACYRDTIMRKGQSTEESRCLRRNMLFARGGIEYVKPWCVERVLAREEHSRARETKIIQYLRVNYTEDQIYSLCVLIASGSYSVGVVIYRRCYRVDVYSAVVL